MDAYLTAFSLRRKLYFLTRSDVFKGKVVLRIFKALQLIPIYRQQDGGKNPQLKNKETFKFCFEALNNNLPILIFPEGQSEPIHELFEIKKGLARIALGAENEYDFNLDLKIVPVVINYEHHFKPRKKVDINYSKPIHLSEYKEAYKNHPAKAINSLTRDVFSAMKRKVYAINSEGKKSSKILKLLISFLSLTFLPTVILSKLIVKKINDDSFYLSAIATLWLIIGLLETGFALLICIWYLPLTSAVSIVILKLIVGLVLLLNSNNLITKNYEQ